MWRKTHQWIGLFISVLIVLVSLTGTILSTKPMYNAYNAHTLPRDMSVATVTKIIATKNKRITPQKLTINANGEAQLNYTIRNKLKKRSISLTTGKFVRTQKEPQIYSFVTTLHRSFFLGDNGRIIPAIVALAMLVLAISGLILLIRRLGGIKKLTASTSWRGLSNQHAGLGRLAIIPLSIMIVSALWLSAITFKIVSTGEDVPPQYPESVQELDYIEPWKLKGLQNIPINTVTEVIYPIPSDWFDVWTVKTDSEYIFIDQFSGEVLSKQPLSIWANILQWMIFLHSGQGNMWWSGVLLLSSLCIPFFAISGTIMWFTNRKSKAGKIHNQAPRKNATTLILVGSENGSTWGFAKALHRGLASHNHKVHTNTMNNISHNYPVVENIFILTSTYGDGDAPQSATKFLSRLQKAPIKNKNINYAILGFGDRAFPQFCAFAFRVADAMQTIFGSPLLPLTTVDKQSSQTFSQWTQQLGEKLSLNLQAEYTPTRPQTQSIQLIAKQDFAHHSSLDIAPISILRFCANSHKGKAPKHTAGDWLAVYPPQCNVPRLYSLASDSNYDKHIEICVRLHKGGICSTYLYSMDIGQNIDVAIIHNPHFHIPRNKNKYKQGGVIMIGAGSGIAPFIGMIKHNYSKRPITLFWGGRSPDIDGIYQEEIKQWLNSRHLTHFYPAWSRMDKKMYVQHLVALHHTDIAEQLKCGATIMICGSSQMALAVAKEIKISAQMVGLTIEKLKQDRRYLEDVY